MLIIGRFGPENAQMSSSQCGDHSCSLLPSICDSACLKFKVTGLRGKPAVGRHNPLIGHYEKIHPASKIHAEFTQCLALRKQYREDRIWGQWTQTSELLALLSISLMRYIHEKQGHRPTGIHETTRVWLSCGCHISAEGMRTVPLQFWSTVK